MGELSQIVGLDPCHFFSGLDKCVIVCIVTFHPYELISGALVGRRFQSFSGVNTHNSMTNMMN